jgi:hypothetical protein
MKFIFSFLLMSTVCFAQSTQNKKVGSPPNAVSRGQSENSGISESPAGVTQEEVQEQRERSQSMGGAPNAGAGTATHTGAGSTVGHKIDDDQ